MRTFEAHFDIIMKFSSIIATLIALIALWSCKTPQDVAYFQDTAPATPADTAASAALLASAGEKLRLQPGDKLHIAVSSSKTPDLAIAFNKIIVAKTQTGHLHGEQSFAPYIMDADGNVIFPSLGVVGLKGLSRAEAAEKLQNELRSRQLLNDAVVTVEILNQFVSVLGEVHRPGRINFDRDRLNLVETLSRCGDLNIDADRKGVLVLRKQDNKVKAFALDLTKRHDLWASPGYQLQPGDVVYVAPNKKRIREAQAYGNVWHQPYIYFSLISVLTSVVSLIIAL